MNTKSKELEVDLAYKINKIHTLKFAYLDLEEDQISEILNNPKAMNLSMNFILDIDKEKSTLALDVHSLLKEKIADKILVEHIGRTVYTIKGLNSIYKEDEDMFNMPDELIMQIYGLAYTHSRALLAVELSPTVFKDKYFLPILNPKEFLKEK